MKMNTVLALTDSLRTKYKNMVADYTKFFSKSQGAFQGEKNTYEPKVGTIDDPSKRSIRKIQTTVDEKFNWFVEESKDFINLLFSQEKTNANNVKAELIVEGVSWGTFTSLELLRLKSLLESADLGNIESMLSEIPVRSDSQVWYESSNSDYSGRNVYETDIVKGVAKTTVKEHFILSDPNVTKGEVKNYTPQVSVRDTVLELGDYTRQVFSGEWSQVQRANALKRRNTLLTAVIKALKEANDCECLISDLTAEKIFGYILNNK